MTTYKKLPLAACLQTWRIRSKCASSLSLAKLILKARIMLRCSIFPMHRTIHPGAKFGMAGQSAAKSIFKVPRRVRSLRTIVNGFCTEDNLDGYFLKTDATSPNKTEINVLNKN